ncbi:GAF domain-containing protein [filamentous cyanobacterium LEGE 11480]|uniref:GAF domain-containing protein n=1 Tax=Romeriopsis navalis LEGE 11480 TaxID=2777977 RepID=A0A928VMV9_9CYAN|nr:GAF domain-containing protein [Romeriopsis navalis]MBE9030537.1 GAF domain-containing protein [Romeriopsis navalis LEGE 11480]
MTPASPEKATAAAQTQHSVPLPPPVKGISLRSEPSQAVEPVVEVGATPPQKPVKLRLKLALKTLVAATAVGALPLFAVGAVSYAWMNHSMTEGLAQQQQATAAQLSDQLHQFLLERVQDVEQLVEGNLFQGDRLTTAAKLGLLEQQKSYSASFKHLALLDHTGKPTLQTKGTKLSNQSTEIYFQQVLKTKDVVVVPMPTDAGGATLIIAVPMTSGNQITGVMMAQLNPEAMQQQLLTASVNLGQPYITDAEGKVLFAIDKAQLNQPVEQVLPGLQNSLQASSTAGAAVSQRLRFGLSVLGLKDSAQPDQLVGWATSQTDKVLSQLNWRTVVAANPEGVLQQQQYRASQFGFAFLAGLGVVGLVGLLVARRTNRVVNDQVKQLERQYASLQTQQQLSIERSQWLGQMIETMRQSMGEAALLNTTVTELRYALSADRVMFYRCNDDWSGTIIAESVGANYRQFMGQTVNDLFREGSIERYQDEQVQVIPDVGRLGLTRAHKEMLAKFEIRASLIAPILQHGKLIGLLCAHQCATTRQWEPEDVDVFAKLSSQLGFVLEQSALISRQAKSVEKSRILNEIVDSMRRSFKEEDILNTTVNELRYTLEADRVVVYRIDGDQSAIILAESVGLTFSKLSGRVLRNPFPAAVMERFRVGQVWCMPDIDAEGLPPEFRAKLDELQVRGCIVAPVIQNGELVGLLSVHACEAARAWEKEDIGLVARLGGQLGLALNQAAILRRQTLSAERLRTLNEIVSVMRRSLKETEILNTAVQELRLILDADRVIVYRFATDPRQLDATLPLSHAGDVAAEATALSSERLAGRDLQGLFTEMPLERFKNGHVQSIPDIYLANLSPEHLQLLEDLQIRATIVAPILQNGELTGLLCAYDNDLRRWETQDLDLFAKLAIQLGYALDQSALIADTEREREAAKAAADATAEAQQLQQERFQQRAQELLRQVEPLTRGDLTVQARESNDEVGTIAKSYNEVIDALRETIAQVQFASRSVAATASDSEGAVSSLSLESRQQIQTVAHAIEQVQTMMNALHQIAARAEEAEGNVQRATKKLQSGDEVMDRTVSGMSSIRETVAETAKKVKRLGEASQKISRVVNLINGFATQTNLLAMNASIEAAKAGEEGQGFVVVAEEVRTLAQQSAAATAEIEQVVEEIQRQTNEVVAAMETGTEHVVNGTQLVEESRMHLSEITEVGMQLNQMVRDISQAAAAQTETSVSVKQTMLQVATIADTTSQQTQTVAESFSHLLKMAEDLQTSAAQFKVRRASK